jgi:fructosamine-3-kinase
MSEAADLKRRVESALGQQVSSQVRLGGGCIAVASRMMLADGRVVFAKGGAGAAGFAAEAAGLGELADFGRDDTDWLGPRVPEVLHVDQDVLVLEWLDLEPRVDAAAWGSALARLHRRSNGGRKQFGFAQDGMLGSTPQAHGWCDDWITFWRDRRLRPMLDLVQDETVRRLGEAVDARLPELLRGCTAKPSLIHGDLWSGNISQVDGHPTTFDPAAYWADREADFGMIRWMGGLGTAFEEAYTKTWPLEAGSERRILLYELHHHLNHLVLFGASYRNGCIRILQQLLDL